MTWLWQHQRDAIAWLLAGGKLLHHGMGAGKTRTVIEFLAALSNVRDVDRVLVCCPKAVMPAWAKQVNLWAGGRFRVVLLDQSTRERKEKALLAALADTSPLIVVANYDSAWRMKPIERQAWTCSCGTRFTG